MIIRVKEKSKISEKEGAGRNKFRKWIPAILPSRALPCVIISPIKVENRPAPEALSITAILVRAFPKPPFPLLQVSHLILLLYVKKAEM